MAEMYNPDKRNISELLSMTSPAIIVPDWQRNYSWTTSHVETFWNDILRFKEAKKLEAGGEYFLGSIVIVKTKDQKHLLLDGQQRIVTAAVLLSVIREFLKKYNINAATRTQQKYLADFDDASGEIVYKISLNIYDRSFFRDLILKERSADYKEPKPEIASHILIRRAYDFFSNVFMKEHENRAPEDAFKWCLDIQNNLLRGMTVIAVVSEDEDSAADVFETLNDRGIGLSTPDLLRNLIIRNAGQANQEYIVEKWRDIIQFDSDNAIKNFLRHYWISHYGDVKTQSLYREMKNFITDNKIESRELTDKLSESANTYKDITDKNMDDTEINEYIKDIQDCKGNILLPALLSICDVLNAEQQKTAILALKTLFVRHSVICELENSKLENIVYKAARELREHHSLDTFISTLRNSTPDDETVERAFATLTKDHNATRRYILVELEKALRKTEEIEVAPPKKVHVEHIYPQTPENGEKFDHHAQIVNRIGNLTILSSKINTSLKNKTFSEKKEKYANSELQLTLELLAHEEWNPESIDNRQRKLAEMAPRIWPVHLADN
ncbi:DUF262 domain-containing protein [Labrenzia sp. R4_1]|uniref:DUF262 domain-containing protein n=1 Tax=Labrenzia sp. R4_1 TaxID=2821106 RepID=UPI001AD98D35|nr:DUF262 domain-containing protein [Labrenzia sp. R4_1]MBO9425532.1 DUF262 domain-containing protein [Labrenzia sp. R4_1]